MKLRAVAVAAGVLAVLFGGSTAASAVVDGRTAATGDWGCVVVRTVNQAVCLENPLPERLPVPN